jgi:tagaturonate reductase
MKIRWPLPPGSRNLPERVLQFGTGMLLRALCAASVDAANRAGRIAGRIVVVQSTPRGHARALNDQDGLFTLVERGLEDGERVERSRVIGSISRALVADTEWDAVREQRDGGRVSN